MTVEEYNALNAPDTKARAGDVVICGEGIPDDGWLAVTARYEDALRRVKDLLPKPTLPLTHQIHDIVAEVIK